MNDFFKKYLIVGVVFVQLGYIYYLVAGITRAKNKPAVLGAYATPIQREDLVFTVINGQRTFWEHRGGEVEEARADWLPNVVTYRLNKEGLNSVNNYTYERARNVFRVITLGDSFTFGAWVNTADNYSSRLEALLNEQEKNGKNYEVLNLGEIGYDVDFITTRYALKGKKYDSDLLVMLLPEPDFTEISGMMKLAVGNEDFQLRSAVTDDIERQMIAIGNAHERLNQLTGNKIELYQIAKLNDFLSATDKPVMLLTDDKTSYHGRFMLERVAALHPNVYFEVLPAFDRLPDLHPSSLGHTQIASAIKDILAKRHFLE